MHPVGVQFGLSRGLLQLRGDDVFLADRLIESVSLEAQLYVEMKKPPTSNTIFSEMVTRVAREALAHEQQAQRQEIITFFAGLPRALYHTLITLAEKASMGRRQGKNGFITDEEVWHQFSERAVDVKPQKTLARVRKSLFAECRDVVRQRYAERDPQNAKHTDLMALFLFNRWNGTGLLAMAEALVVLHSSQSNS
jgi:hypothetical protein